MPSLLDLHRTDAAAADEHGALATDIASLHCRCD